ncbi:MAG: hypothetical protein HY842_13705 [Bacteroidetes bacterium]|nr:hypothetical protein [Bacteroidota bacterium]
MLKILQLSPRAFWDVNMDTLDEETHADWIIVRVFEWGSYDDLMEVWVFYGKEKIRKALTAAPYLTEKTLLFGASLLNLKPADFRCYNTKQYHPIARSFSNYSSPDA